MDLHTVNISSGLTASFCVQWNLLVLKFWKFGLDSKNAELPIREMWKDKCFLLRLIHGQTVLQIKYTYKKTVYPFI